MPTVSAVDAFFIGAVRHRSVHTVEYYYYQEHLVIDTCTATHMC